MSTEKTTSDDKDRVQFDSETQRQLTPNLIKVVSQLADMLCERESESEKDDCATVAQSLN